MRLSCYVTVHGECAVLRVLNKQTGLVGLDELGMNPSMLERYRSEVLEPPTGVAIITGPTGSGKTTTLYSSLDYCNEVDRKIITVEDPVEFVIDGIIQCSVFDKVGRSFEASLREIVRQDPDIIVLGEIRDKITAQTAIQPAHIIRQISTDTTGLISMREDGIAKVVKGKTTFDEILKHTPRTGALRSLPQIMTMTQ